MSHPWESEWEIVGPLGAGGQGVTRLVKSIANPSHRGVLKYLKNNKSATARARMLREVANLQSLAKLGGKVPSVFSNNTESLGDAGTELFLVMEYIEGPTLKDLVESEGKLDVDRAIAFTLDLCGTVSVAHTEGILHRDIKPDNIVVKTSDKAHLFIVDYGLSFNVDDDDLTEDLETFRNKFLDLPETNAPGGDRRDPRSDVTALCAVFYYMLTGNRPGHLQDGSGVVPHLRPGYSVREAISEDRRRTQIELLLSRGLAVPIQGRFQNIDELAGRLERLHQQSASDAAVDPSATALELSDQIRTLDRKTQIAEFRPIADRVLDAFIHKSTSRELQLGRFKLRLATGGPRGPELASGLDSVTGATNAYLSIEHHDSKRYRTYTIASRGEQCVVCVCDYDQSTGSKPTPSDWREIAWYEGDPDDVELVRSLDEDLKIWIDESLRAIAQDVISS